jgi:hypothetical protein
LQRHAATWKINRVKQLAVLAVALLCPAVAVIRPAAQSASPAARDVASVEGRAIAYLAREVPAWRREHPCYSCHNNGDAARALVAGRTRVPEARSALDDTLAWLGAPRRWETNGGGEGGSDDKRLARIQFAFATAAASLASLVPPAAVAEAAEIVARDQQPDGSWRLDSSDSIGSPATYGTALATAVARRTLLRSGVLAMKERIRRAERWLGAVAVHNTPDAAAVLFAFADGADESTLPNIRAALEFLSKSQGRDGGWGAYATSPAEPFDTALAVIALHDVAARRASAVASTRATIEEAVARGRRYLIAQQIEDGSWVETTRPAGQVSYAQRISTTAWALLALHE